MIPYLLSLSKQSLRIPTPYGSVFWGDEIKDDEVVGACNVFGGKREMCIRGYFGEK